MGFHRIVIIFIILHVAAALTVPPIVDGGGYRIERDGMCMTAMSPQEGQEKNELGLVQTLPWTNAMDQKWSVEMFGSDINITPSNNKRNNVTFTLNTMLSSINYEIRLIEDQAQFRVINKQTKLCVTYGEFVTLGSCDSVLSLWTFFRIG